MRNTITVHAVMAFFPLAVSPAFAVPDDAIAISWGESGPCEVEDALVGATSAGAAGRVLAVYQQFAERTDSVRVLQQGNRFFLEVANRRVRRSAIERALAERIHARLAEDISRNAFAFASDEIQIHGVWFSYSADGVTCARMSYLHQNPRALAWSMVFDALQSDDAARGANARFWLNQLEQVPATAPTSLAGSHLPEGIQGAAANWSFRGREPLAILNHRAHVEGSSVQIAGEIANQTGIARNHVWVIATFLDDAGSEIATQHHPIEFSPLPGKTRSPFDFYIAAQNVASYTLRLDAGEAVRLRKPTLRIVAHQARNDDEDLEIRGTVRNSGKDDQRSVQIYVCLYDKAGRLLTYDWDTVDGDLKAGESAGFEILVERPPGFHRYEVAINPDYLEL